MTRDDLRASLADGQITAFLRCIRQGESNQDDSAYTLINGGGRITSFAAHPWYGVSTTHGARATGAYQFLGTTWAELAGKYGFQSFTPAEQDEGAVALILERGAGNAIRSGDFKAACAALHSTWTSLPGGSESNQSLSGIERVFVKYGGILQPTADVTKPHGDSVPQSVDQPGKSMGALQLLQVFGPILSTLIPQISTILKPGSQSAQRDAGLAQVIIDTITKTAGSPNLQGAIETMQADPSVKKAVQEAVAVHPDILPLMEVGGGASAAMARDAKAAAADKPFYKVSAVFWISVVLVPLVYWLVGSTIVGGIAIPEDWPWYVQFPLKLFGNGWTGEARSSTSSLVIGLVLGGICGVYYGISVTQNKQQQQGVTSEGH